ncbi:MAG: TldD/PmbA family protein [Bryobacteraceae bacterium]
MSDLLTESKCRELLDVAASGARGLGVRDVELLVGVSAEALTRFANNAIHQNVAESSHYVSVRVQEDQRTARASTNRFEAGAIGSAVAEAVAAMRVAQPDEELPPLAEPESVPSLDRRDAKTARVTPAGRARCVAEAIAAVEEGSLTAAGIYATEEDAHAVVNSRGVLSLHRETMARFSITAMAADSSGWAKAGATAAGAFDPVSLARSAALKAALSRNPREMPPGEYTVILEPAAVLDLVGQIFPDFSGTALDDQRSFLTGRMGARLFGENITIVDDSGHDWQSGPPFDGEGLPRRRITLVDKGVPLEIARSRANARRHDAKSTGHSLPIPSEAGETVVNVVISGGGTSLAEMIASTERGILVTRLWYIREVDPFEKIMTGMTRDGTFLVEGGEIVCGVRNFRFNQSVVTMLNRVEAMSPAVRASGEEAMDMVVPAMKVGGFRFSEVTRF